MTKRRPKDMIERAIADWARQKAQVEERIDRLAVEERQNPTPAGRVAIEQERGNLKSQVKIINGELAKVKAELDDWEAVEKGKVADLQAMGPQGQAAWADWLAALEALENATGKSLALERDAARLGCQDWPKVPAVMITALTQTRKAIAFRESVAAQRIENAERMAEREKNPPPKPGASAAARAWAGLREFLEGEG